MRIGYRTRTQTVVFASYYTPEAAAREVERANRAEQGENLSGIQATRPPRSTDTIWFTVEDVEGEPDATP